MNRSSKNMDWTIGKRLLTLAGALGLTAGLGFPPALDAQGPARKLGNTPPNFIGATDVYEDETTDLTLITSGAASEIWATDPFGDNISNPRRITSLGSNLTPASKRFINPNFGQRAFGLGEITHGPEAGLIFVLDPGLQQVGSPQPQLGLMDSNGNIAQTPQGLGTFRLIQGITQAVVLTSMDVHPFDDEIVVFDENNSTFSFLSFTANFEYQVVRGPFPILGSATFFGGGICYNPQDPV